MSSATGAFAFLITRTVKNRLASQLARLKSPRYALALIVGVLYFWSVFARPGASPRTPGAAAVAGAGGPLGTVAGIGFSLTVLAWWLLGGVTTALAFHPAEVQLLFPAPVSRRGLIGYKVARSQIGLLLGGVIWALMMRRWGVTLAAPLRLLTAWGVFSVLHLHRLGAALVQAPPVRGGRLVGLIAGKTLAAAAALALAVGVAPALLRLGTLGFAEGVRLVGAALAAPPPAVVLAPFRLVLAPLYATSPDAWLRAFAVVVGIVALHLLWVLAMRVEFEEVAAGVSADLARRIAAFKERRAGGAAVIKPGKVTRSWLPLAPVGLPAVAIAWKNTIALVRTGGVRATIVAVAILAVAMRMMASAAGGGAAWAAPLATFALLAFILGPRVVRNDLRQDLLSLASIKSYPLSGTAVVAAEMASPTLALAAFQAALLLAAYAMLPPGLPVHLGRGTTAGLLMLAPFVLVALNAVSVAIQNGAALLFPAWVRLGADSGGVEAIGQTLLVTIGSVLVLSLALVPPALAGLVVLFLVKPALGVAGAVPAGAVGVVGLGVEIAMLVWALGRVFDRTDPTAFT